MVNRTKSVILYSIRDDGVAAASLAGAEHSQRRPGQVAEQHPSGRRCAQPDVVQPVFGGGRE